MALFGEGLPGEGIVVDAWGTSAITDVCGAGDTAAAVFALALAAKYPAPEAMYLANVASGIVVLEHGAAVCPIGALDDALGAAPMPVNSFELKRH
jgi:bifunctional ADP-heptose synthase (sugar kinase/adenylyltransferase)